MTRKPARPKRQTIAYCPSASSQPTSQPDTAIVRRLTGALSSLGLTRVDRAVLCAGSGDERAEDPVLDSSGLRRRRECRHPDHVGDRRAADISAADDDVGGHADVSVGPAGAGAARLPVDAMVATAATERTGDAPMTVTLRSDPRAPASVALGQRTLFVNPYTGEVLGEGAPGVRAFFRSVTEWHRWLAASAANRATARGITGAANLAFFIIVLSGPFLWWPKRLTWTQIRNIAWFRGGLPPKARDFNWHNTLGIWSAIPLVVIVGSGVVMSYPWANNLVYRVNGEQPPAPAGRGADPGGGRGGDPRGGGREGRIDGSAGGRDRWTGSGGIAGASSRDAAAAVIPKHQPLDTLIATAAQQRPAWRTIAVRLPVPRGPVALTIDEGNGGQPHKRGTLTVDADHRRDRPVGGAGRTLRGPARPDVAALRATGEVYGVVGQTVAGLASLAGAILVYTGVAMSLRRLRAWRRRSRAEAPPTYARPAA